MCSPVSDVTHVTDFILTESAFATDESCQLCNTDAIPSFLSAFYTATSLWDASDPRHSHCRFGQLCVATGEKSCSRLSYMSQLHHFYGTCGMMSPGHVFCTGPSMMEKPTQDGDRVGGNRLFPSCAECGVLIEIQGLILINRRLMDDPTQVVTEEDRELVRCSIKGYVRAYRVRRTKHVIELRQQADRLYESELAFARSKMGGSGWLSRVVNRIHQLCRGGW